jgi:hypothetical protein
MTTLRSRLLITLVLAAVLLSALGTVASARTFQRQGSPAGGSAVATRPGMGRFSGEPDPNGGGAPCPPKIEKTSMVMTPPGIWLVQRWLQWRLRSPYTQAHSKR